MSSSAALQGAVRREERREGDRNPDQFCQEVLFESFVAQSTKVGELYTVFVTMALKPAEQIIAKTDATANATHPVVSKTKAAA